MAERAISNGSSSGPMWLGVLVLIFVLATAWLVLKRNFEDAQSPSRATPDQAGVAAEEDVEGSTNGAVLSVGQLRRRTDPVLGSASHMESIATELSQLADTLLPLARSGDYSSLEVLQRLLHRCSPFSDPARPPSATAPHGTPAHSAQLAQIDRDGRYCDWANAGVSATELLAELSEIRRGMLEAGEPLAAMAQLALPEFARDAGLSGAVGEVLPELRELAWANATSPGSAQELQTALGYLLAQRPSDLSGIPQLTSAQSVLSEDARFTSLDPSRQAHIREAALGWLGCEHGASCGPYGVEQSVFCLIDGNCASHLNYQEFIRQRLLTPTEFELLQRYLEALRAALAGGG